MTEHSLVLDKIGAIRVPGLEINIGSKFLRRGSDGLNVTTQSGVTREQLRLHEDADASGPLSYNFGTGISFTGFRRGPGFPGG